MKALATIVLVFCFIASSAQYSLYKNGVDYYNSGRFTEAESSLSEYLGRTSRDKSLDVEAYYVRGMAFYKNSQYPKAISDFQQALALGRKNTGNLYWIIGKCQSALGENGAAVESYSLALPLITDTKKQAQLLFDRAIVYKRAQRKDLAEVDLKTALTYNPEHYLAQETLAEIVSSTNQSLSQKSSDASSSRRMALIIGNAKYPESVGQLKNPANDAFAIADELKKLGFETTVKVNLTAAEIKQTIRSFHSLLKEHNPTNTIGLFYYSGHGLQLDGTNYMVPIDVIIKEPKDIERLCVTLDAPLDAMQYADVKMSIMILDACRNNPYSATAKTVASGLAPPNPAVGAFIAYATAPGSVASDGAGVNGLYTQELIKVLHIPGLTIEQVFKKVRENVLTLSRGKQHTWDTSNLINEFYFRK